MAKERLDRVLAHLGLGSRTEMKQLIRRGRIAVNGVTAEDPGQHVDPEADTILYDGEPVTYRRHFHVLFHKPGGYITAIDDPRKPTIMDVLPEPYHHRGIFPVGRLDKDTEGLLLLTTDGELAHRLLSPRWHVDKCYFVRVDRPLDPEADPQAFAEGVLLTDDNYRCLPARLTILSPCEAEVVIQEGKYHQVKRMFGARGKRVVYLKRLQFGPLALGDLPLGDARHLTEAEVSALYAAVSLASAKPV